MAAKNTEVDASPAEGQQAEADAITSDGYITVPLTGYEGDTKDVRARLATKWRSSALRAVNNGDFDGFMERILHEDDFELYLDLDPDAESMQKFAEDAATLSGEALGKSSGPSRSGRSTRKR